MVNFTSVLCKVSYNCCRALLLHLCLTQPDKSLHSSSSQVLCINPLLTLINFPFKTLILQPVKHLFNLSYTIEIGYSVCKFKHECSCSQD